MSVVQSEEPTPAPTNILEPTAPPIEEAKANRAGERLTPDGKAESLTERGELYNNTEGVTESGTQAGEEGVQTSDLNPIGRRTA